MVRDRWRAASKGDPVPWLLEPETPAVRHLALRWLLDEPEDAPIVRRARAAAMRTDPIAAVLAAQHPDGYWVKPGSGYGPKYTSTVWSLMFLDQLGADPRDRGIQLACAYVLEHTQAPSGGFGMDGTNSGVVHCLHGNVLHALIRFGWGDDDRVRAAVAWQARAITGEGIDRWYPWATSGPAFSCGIILSQQDELGRWRNERAYERKTWVPFERTRSPSRWVTLRACSVLKAAL